MSELVFASLASEIKNVLKMNDVKLIEMLYGFVANPLNHDVKHAQEGEYVPVNKTQASNILNRKIGGEITDVIRNRAYDKLVLQNIERNVEESILSKIHPQNRSDLIQGLINIIKNDRAMESEEKSKLLHYAEDGENAKFIGQTLLYCFTIPNVPESLICMTEFDKRYDAFLGNVKYKPPRKTREQWFRWISNDSIRHKIEEHIQELQNKNNDLHDLLLRRFESERKDYPSSLVKEIEKAFGNKKDSKAVLLLFLYYVCGNSVSELDFFDDDLCVSKNGDSLEYSSKEKDDGTFVVEKLPQNTIEEIKRILGFENVKEKIIVVLPLFSAIIAVLSLVFLFSRSIEFYPNDSHPDVTDVSTISTGTTTSSTIIRSISTSTTTVNTIESTSNNIYTSTSNTDTTTTTDDILIESSLTNDITEPLDDNSGESNVGTEAEETTVLSDPIILNKTQLMLNTVGDSRTYHLTCNGVNLRNLNWTSSNPAIVSVTQDGIVTGLEDGTTTIMVTANGSIAFCTVTVRTSYDESWSDWSDWTATPITASNTVQVQTENRSEQVLSSYNMDSYCTVALNPWRRQFRNRSVDGNFTELGLSPAYGEYHDQYTFSVAEVQSATVIHPGEQQGGSQNGTNACDAVGYSMLYGDAYYIFFITSENYDTITTTYYSSRVLTRTPTVYHN